MGEALGIYTTDTDDNTDGDIWLDKSNSQM